MAEDKLIGINEAKLDRLVLDSYDYIEKINTKFDSISNQMDNMFKALGEDNAKAIRSKYNSQKEEYLYAKKLLIYMTEQLINAKNNSKNATVKLVDQVSVDSKKTHDLEIKLIDKSKNK